MKNISIIVAVSENGVIGNENKLIWHLPADLKHFKNLTTGHCIVMGRKTYDSIGRPLPNRINIVVSRSKNLSIDGCEVVPSLEEALEVASKRMPNDEIFIIGGANVYQQALKFADTIYLTKVHADFEGDTFFDFDKTIWTITEEIKMTADEKNSYNYSFLTYQKS